MIIIQDTREQKPLEFKHYSITEVFKQKMDVGDYCAEFKDGYRPPIVFDRKSISDLYGTMGKGYPRFKKCIQRAQEQNIQLFIIVEGSLTKVSKGYSRSKIKGSSMVQKLFTLSVRYGVHTIFCSTRKEMAYYITHFYCGIGREHTKK